MTVRPASARNPSADARQLDAFSPLQPVSPFRPVPSQRSRPAQAGSRNLPTPEDIAIFGRLLQTAEPFNPRTLPAKTPGKLALYRGVPKGATWLNFVSHDVKQLLVRGMSMQDIEQYLSFAQGQTSPLLMQQHSINPTTHKISTSEDPMIAARFAGPGGVVIRFDLPYANGVLPGKPNRYSVYQEEREWLVDALPPRQATGAYRVY